MNRTIYLLWLQGWENAPYLQKEVAKSWEIQNPNWKIEYVSFANLKNYVNDIDYIYDASKQITPQALSDIIRVSLLRNHGGVWADATMLCMQPLDGWLNDDIIFNNIWMYYREKGGAQGTKALYSFIVSTTRSKIIKQLKIECDIYWNARSSAHTYFWLDYLIYNLLKKYPECNREFANMPKIEADDLGQAHGLAGAINGVEKMHLDIPEFKRLILENPPYVLKLWKHYNENSDGSNGSYAIEMSKRPITKLHPFISKSFQNSETG